MPFWRMSGETTINSTTLDEELFKYVNIEPPKIFSLS